VENFTGKSGSQIILNNSTFENDGTFKGDYVDMTANSLWYSEAAGTQINNLVIDNSVLFSFYDGFVANTITFKENQGDYVSLYFTWNNVAPSIKSIKVNYINKNSNKFTVGYFSESITSSNIPFSISSCSATNVVFTENTLPNNGYFLEIAYNVDCGLAPSTITIIIAVIPTGIALIVIVVVVVVYVTKRQKKKKEEMEKLRNQVQNKTKTQNASIDI